MIFCSDCPRKFRKPCTKRAQATLSQALSYLQQGETRGRLPPGQYLERGFPVLSAGPTLHTPLISWEFSIVEEVDQPKRWAWDEFRALCKRLPGRDHESAIATRDELAMPRGGNSRHRQLRSPWDKEAVPTPEPTEYCPGGFPAPAGSTSGLRTRHAEPALRRRLTAAAYRASSAGRGRECPLRDRRRWRWQRRCRRCRSRQCPSRLWG